MVKKIFVTGLVLIAAFAFTGCFPFTGCDGRIDPSDSFGSLEELQAVLPEGFHYFDFDERIMVPGSYAAITNTQSYKRRQKGDFEYIGYYIYFTRSPLTDYYQGINFVVSANSEKTLDGVADEIRKNSDANIVEETITIDGIECLYIYGPEIRNQLYFMIGNVRYWFEYPGTNKTMFLSMCEPAITSRYQFT
jgi:hypothetical protein